MAPERKKVPFASMRNRVKEKGGCLRTGKSQMIKMHGTTLENMENVMLVR